MFTGSSHVQNSDRAATKHGTLLLAPLLDALASSAEFEQAGLALGDSAPQGQGGEGSPSLAQRLRTSTTEEIGSTKQRKHRKQDQGEGEEDEEWEEDEGPGSGTTSGGRRAVTRSSSGEYALKKPRVQSKKMSWEDRYEQLKAFYNQFGHCNVTQHDKSLRSLGNWVSKQRQRKKKGYKTKYSKLTDWQVSKLDEICFEWDRSKWAEKKKEQPSLASVKRRHQGTSPATRVASSSSLSSLSSSSPPSSPTSVSTYSSSEENEDSSAQMAVDHPEAVSSLQASFTDSSPKAKLNFLLNTTSTAEPLPSQQATSSFPVSPVTRQLELLVKKCSDPYEYRLVANVASVSDLISKVCSTFQLPHSARIYYQTSNAYQPLPQLLDHLPSKVQLFISNSL